MNRSSHESAPWKHFRSLTVLIAVMACAVISIVSATSASAAGSAQVSSSATQDCNTGAVTGTASATGIPRKAEDGGGYYQGLLFLYYGNTQLGSSESDVNGDVSFTFTFSDTVGATSAQLEIDSPTQSGGVAIPFDVTWSGCTTPPPPPVDNGPTAVFTTSPRGGLVVWFNGSGSFGGTPPYVYQWSFGDGTTSNDAAPGDHMFPAPGQYTVTLTVTDASGLSSLPISQKMTVGYDARVTVVAAKGVRAGGKEKVAIAVTDTSGAVSDTPVAIQVTGKDTVSGTVTTNSAGRAIFTYRTHRAGKDKITATADGVSASTTVSILRPVERPTVHAASRKGVVNVTVLTSPRIAHHTVTVYRYHKVHGHWKWSRVGTAHTASNGRAHLALSLPHGKQRLRAIVSDKHYVERYSKVCSVQVQ